ncbi:MAG: hypothetical protein ACI4F1_10700 [Bariatricus sp.]
MEMKKYKMAASAGIIIMGIGSFMSCLANAASAVIAGDILLILSILILIYAFSNWQP